MRSSQLACALLALLAAGCEIGPTLELGDNRPEGVDAGPDGGGLDAPDAAADSSASEPDTGHEPEDDEPVTCTTATECESDDRPHCVGGECVECRAAADCSDPERPWCVAGTCAECEQPGTCEDGN